MKIFSRFSVTLVASLSIFSSILQAANPAEAKTIGRTIREMPELSSFLQLLEKTGVGSTLSESTSASYTVFAPTDEAFAKLPAGTLESLLKPENKKQLANILTYHVVSGKVMSKDVKSGAVKMVNGQTAKLKANKKGVKINNAKVVKVDILTSNGVIHVIDTVILPKKK